VVGTSEMIVEVTGAAVKVIETEVVDTVTIVVGLGVIVVNVPDSETVTGGGVTVNVAENVLRDTETEILVKVESEVAVAVVEKVLKEVAIVT